MKTTPYSINSAVAALLSSEKEVEAFRKTDAALATLVHASVISTHEANRMLAVYLVTRNEERRNHKW